MKFKETEILRKIEIKLPEYDLIILLKALELYLTNIKHLINNKFIKTEEYDDIYFNVWCLYNIISYNITKEKIICDKIPIHKRITKKIISDKLENYMQFYNKNNKEVA